MKELTLEQMERVEGGITWGCAGNAILVGAAIGTGNVIAAIGLTMIAADMGCLDEW
jgi:hypothetical protein